MQKTSCKSPGSLRTSAAHTCDTTLSVTVLPQSVYPEVATPKQKTKIEKFLPTTPFWATWVRRALITALCSLQASRLHSPVLLITKLCSLQMLRLHSPVLGTSLCSLKVSRLHSSVLGAVQWQHGAGPTSNMAVFCRPEPSVASQ